MLEQIIKNIERKEFFEFRYDEDKDMNLWFVNTGFIPYNAPVYFEDKELIKATDKMTDYLSTCCNSEKSSVGRCLRLVGVFSFNNILVSIDKAVS